METTHKNGHFGISYCADTVSISGQPFILSVFGKPVLCGKVDIVKCVSVQPHWVLRGFNERFMEVIRFMLSDHNEKTEWR